MYKFCFCLMQYSKSYGKWPETYSPCMVIKTYNLNILPSFLHCYHIPQLQNIAIPAMTFSPHNFEIFWTLIIFFWISNPNYFFFFFFEKGSVSIIVGNIQAWMGINWHKCGTSHAIFTWIPHIDKTFLGMCYKKSY